MRPKANIVVVYQAGRVLPDEAIDRWLAVVVGPAHEAVIRLQAHDPHALVVGRSALHGAGDVIGVEGNVEGNGFSVGDLHEVLRG